MVRHLHSLLCTPLKTSRAADWGLHESGIVWSALRPSLFVSLYSSVKFSLLTQTSGVYFEIFCKDRLWAKCFVAWIWIMEVIQTVLIVIDAIRVFGNGWGDKQALDGVGLVWFSVPLMTGISTLSSQSRFIANNCRPVSLSVQIFFAWRIWVLSQAFWIPAAVISVRRMKPSCLSRLMRLKVSIVQCMGGIWAGIRAHQVNTFIQLQEQVFTTTSVSVMHVSWISIGLNYPRCGWAAQQQPISSSRVVLCSIFTGPNLMVLRRIRCILGF